MRSFITAIFLMATFTFVAPAAHAGASCFGTCEGSHPTNSAGYVTDGTPQNDDTKCVGSESQRLACLLARRPDCRHWTQAMPRSVAQECWAPEINIFGWDHQPMFDALYCESKGEESIWTHGPYRGLLQDDGGTGDAYHDFLHAYYVKWAGQQSSAWSQTYGRWC